MKKFLVVLLCVAMLATAALGLAACGKPNPKDIPDTCAANADGDWVVALVTDAGTIDDESFNQGTWEGTKLFAYQNKLSYAYYKPTTNDKAGRLAAVKNAVDKGAQIVICPGFLFEDTLYEAQSLYPDVKFVLIDGEPHDADYNYHTNDNVHCILFQEEQAGYLAGYAIVMDGYTKLGFFGGMAVPAVIRYGYGFVQGADAAAKKLGVTIEIKYAYGGDFVGNATMTAKMKGWYSAGTEVVFSCGGGIYTSVLEAAKSVGRGTKVIGVDVDQYYIDEVFVTSALKQLAESVQIALEKWNKGEWTAMGGKTVTLGAKDNCIGLPTVSTSWRFNEFKVADYNKLFKQIRNGTVVVDNNAKEDVKPTVSSNTTVNYDA